MPSRAQQRRSRLYRGNGSGSSTCAQVFAKTQEARKPVQLRNLEGDGQTSRDEGATVRAKTLFGKSAEVRNRPWVQIPRATPKVFALSPTIALTRE